MCCESASSNNSKGREEDLLIDILPAIRADTQLHWKIFCGKYCREIEQ
jgi:hypothetical protein